MQQRIINTTGVLNHQFCLIRDVDGLWAKYACDKVVEDAGALVRHVNDEMLLRKVYECEILYSLDQKWLIVVDDASVYIPWDIQVKFMVVELSFSIALPNFDARSLKELPGVDLDQLAVIAEDSGFTSLDYDATIDLCLNGLREGYYAKVYGLRMLDDAVDAACNAISHRDWTAPAIAFGKASMIHYGGTELTGFADKQLKIEHAFIEWIESKYNTLSGVVDSARPVLLSKVNDYIRKNSKKRALIVMDGMSFSNFFTIQRLLASESLTFDIQSSFSFFPTVTSVARQSIFSGKLPIEHEKPFDLANEEKQWFEYWRNAGLRNEEIAFIKSETPEISAQAKAVGIIINICDDLMHGELQGLTGLQQGVENWMKKGRLLALIRELLQDGFDVFMTSDHGNTSAIAQGRFTKPGLLADPASRRAVIYKSFADAIELEKFSALQYFGSYLPKEISAFLFEPGVCYGDKDKEYITHGGMTLEEAIVPFVRIGDNNG